MPRRRRGGAVSLRIARARFQALQAASELRQLARSAREAAYVRRQQRGQVSAPSRGAFSTRGPVGAPCPVGPRSARLVQSGPGRRALSSRGPVAAPVPSGRPVPVGAPCPVGAIGPVGTSCAGAVAAEWPDAGNLAGRRHRHQRLPAPEPERLPEQYGALLVGVVSGAGVVDDVPHPVLSTQSLATSIAYRPTGAPAPPVPHRPRQPASTRRESGSCVGVAHCGPVHEPPRPTPGRSGNQAGFGHTAGRMAWPRPERQLLLTGCPEGWPMRGLGDEEQPRPVSRTRSSGAARLRPQPPSPSTSRS